MSAPKPYPGNGAGWSKVTEPKEGEFVCPACQGYGWVDESDRAYSVFACMVCERTGVVTDELVVVFLGGLEHIDYEMHVASLLPGLRAVAAHATPKVES